MTDLPRGAGELEGWPANMRVIARRERPIPGAQLSLFDQHRGRRYHLFVTNIPGLPAGHQNAALNNLAYLDALDRSHARVEDRCGKATGLGKLPSASIESNRA